jgi:hypothetical protein
VGEEVGIGEDERDGVGNPLLREGPFCFLYQITKGDTLEVELETTQVATSKGIKNEHRVLHLSRPQQISLPFEDDQ